MRMKFEVFLQCVLVSMLLLVCDLVKYRADARALVDVQDRIKRELSKDVKYTYHESLPATSFNSDYNTPKITKKCSQSNITLKWEKITDAKFYIILISLYGWDPVHLFNTSETELIFPGKNLIQGGDYERYEYSITPNGTMTSLSPMFKNLGSCPFPGKWSSWLQWKPCGGCDQGRYNGDQIRKRECKSITTSEPFYVIDCDGDAIEHQSCACSIITTTTITTTTTTTTTTAKPKTLNNTTFIAVETKRSTTKSPNGKVDLGPIIGGMLGAFVLILVIIFIVRKRKRELTFVATEADLGGTTVYISYTTESQKEKKILNLIHYVASFGVHCTVDLLCQVDINNMGGLPNWLPSNLSNADKILVILSKSYIKALKSIENGLELVPDKVCKVHTEFNLIRTIMYHSCQRTPQLVIVLDGVKKEDIPDIFRGRHHCLYPKKFENSDESCRSLMGLILDTEPLQIGSSDSIQTFEK